MKIKNLKKYINLKKYYYFILRLFKRLVINIFGTMEAGGERAHLLLKYKIFLDQNEKCHLERYRFVTDFIKEGSVVGDCACGTGYGSILLASKAKMVIGIDIADHVIKKIKNTYKNYKNVDFICENLLNLKYKNTFDYIISFETLEHVEEDEILKILARFKEALKPDGILIFSTPYMQEKSEEAIRMGFHKTFYINENKIKLWIGSVGLCFSNFKYQSHDKSIVGEESPHNDFIITIATNKKV